jgi:CRISPR-associated protein Cmr2
MTQQYYFVCSIGPVQDFIKTARTSQDLWFGSWMLSDLAKAAAKVLKDGGHTLIFPAPEMNLNPDSPDNAANKVVALVNDAPRTVGNAVWQAVENRRDELAQISFDAAQERDNFDRSLAETQLKDLVEFYWAAAPYEESQGNEAYTVARARAEALFAARKATRDFQQARGRDGLPKSSLDGFRESVLPKEPQKGFPFWRFKADKGESLSGVDLLKRWGKRPDDEKFLSTTDIAAKPFEIHLGERCEPLRQAIEALFRLIAERSETPGTLFYVDRLVQLIDDEQKAEKFREEFANLFKDDGVERQPSPYYALLQADGDNMGKTIDEQKEQERHRNLSQALSKFAAQAKDIIRGSQGVPIYVGGDDMLAYLPLHTALVCIKALDKAFKQAMSDFHYDGDKSLTLSVGLAIAHHLTPLSDVLTQARAAEKKAKQVKDKNGLVISLNKRGSAERGIRGKLAELTDRMEQLIGFTQQKAISHGAAYDLEDLQRRLDILEIEVETRNAILRKEAIRIIGRKRESGGDEKVDKETQERFEAWLKDETLTLYELAGEMIIAAELAKAYDMAKEKTV